MECPDCFSLEHDRDLLADLIENQLGTIKALNIALGGEDSTSTENLIDSNEVDYAENGLIALCRELTIENVRLNDVVIFQNNGWSADYDKLTRAEAVIEKCKEPLEMNLVFMDTPVEERKIQPYTQTLDALDALTKYREWK